MTASLSWAVIHGLELGSAGVIRRHVVRSSYMPAMLTTRPAYWQDVHRRQTRRGKHSRCLRSGDPPVQEKKGKSKTERYREKGTLSHARRYDGGRGRYG